ncbi:MAG: M48 family metallopeptidase [Roseovarius sp.]|nr:M48 family metallopeptidase [Roseovarius sp.]
MAQHILSGNPPVAITLRRSARARRISLRVSGIDGTVTLTVPRGVNAAEALAFARSREDWLRGHLARRPEAVPVAAGVLLPIEGALWRIAPGRGRQVVLEAGEARVPGPEEMLAPRLAAWLRGRARDRLAMASDRHAARLGERFTRLTLRDTRSRWGSCSSGGALSYSWRLILAPPEVLDYVAAHEVAHLAEMNHSPAFWALVARLCPGFEAPRRWLRQEGAGLHRYRFD